MEFNNAQQIAYDSLRTRTVRRFKRAHVLELTDGSLLDLDLNFTAYSQEELVAGIKSRCQHIGESGILTPADAPMWERFIVASQKNLRTFTILHSSCHRRIAVLIGSEKENG